MFTGIVETVGTVRTVAGSSPMRICIESSIDAADIKLGDSVAIDGCCLTVVDCQGALTFEAATETLERTTLGGLAAGHRVNLERAMTVGARLDGHLVSGHVDAVGTVRHREQRGSALYFGIAASDEVLRLTAPRGSICIAGVSLTVTDVAGGIFWVALIPHTLAVTRLSDLRVGSGVNLEADLIARYVARLLQPTSTDPLTMQFLEDKGFG